jgi:hypothetical protein
MYMQEQRFFDTRGFRIAVIAVAAAVVLGVAAYFFGTGLRADTSASVAPSPLGSSLTAVRERSSEDYVGRLINASAAARETSLAALAKSRSEFYAELNNSAAASRAASAAAGRFADRYDRMNSSSAAARAASLSAASRFADRYDRMNSSSAAVRGASMAELAGIWAPFYAGLDKAMTDAGARPSQGTSISMVESSTEGQFQWVKPEGIKPSEAADPAAVQNPWIKPEGVRSN